MYSSYLAPSITWDCYISAWCSYLDNFLEGMRILIAAARSIEATHMESMLSNPAQIPWWCNLSSRQSGFLLYLPREISLSAPSQHQVQWPCWNIISQVVSLQEITLEIEYDQFFNKILPGSDTVSANLKKSMQLINMLSLQGCACPRGKTPWSSYLLNPCVVLILFSGYSSWVSTCTNPCHWGHLLSLKLKNIQQETRRNLIRQGIN